MAIERLTSTREYQLARRCRDGDARSRQRLVEHHHRGVRGWKQSVRRRGPIPLLGGVVRVDDLY